MRFETTACFFPLALPSFRSAALQATPAWLLRFAFAWLAMIGLVAGAFPVHAQTAPVRRHDHGAQLRGAAGPCGIAVDGSGNVFVAENNGTVREIAAVNGIVSSSSTQSNVGNRL